MVHTYLKYVWEILFWQMVSERLAASCHTSLTDPHRQLFVESFRELKMFLSFRFGVRTSVTNSRFIWKAPEAAKGWGQKEKRASEDEIAGWYHWSKGHELGQTGKWWVTGRPGVLQSMGLQRVGHDWATEQPPPPNVHIPFISMTWYCYPKTLTKTNSE